MPYISYTVIVLQNGLLYNHDEIFLNKPHKTRRRWPFFGVWSYHMPMPKIWTFGFPTKINYLEITFSNVPNFPTQNDYTCVQRKKKTALTQWHVDIVKR